MNFIEAIKKMKEGYKIRRSNWSKNQYLHKPSFNIYTHDREIYRFDCDEFVSDDWEIKEEIKK